MLKMSMCVKRRADLSPQAFVEYWQNHHAPLVRRHAGVLRIIRYSQTLLLPDSALQQALLASRGAKPYEYDGLGEVWWQSRDDMLALRDTPQAQAAIRELYEDECRFVDHHASLLWYGEEMLIIGEK